MPKKYTGLDIEEHRALGEKIKQIKQLQKEIEAEVWRGYGKSSKAGVAARSVCRIRTLRVEMDNHLCRETSREEWYQNNYGLIYF